MKQHARRLEDYDRQLVSLIFRCNRERVAHRFHVMRVDERDIVDAKRVQHAQQVKLAAFAPLQRKTCGARSEPTLPDSSPHVIGKLRKSMGIALPEAVLIDDSAPVFLEVVP